ncbi:bifunctional nuclease family protein [Planococcus sp. APC 4015]|nr:bifunctional nuclease family protein [Planococcus sp. APC 4015]
MVEARVAGVALDESGQHVLLLAPIAQDPRTGKMLPIWIGALEATSILVAIEGASAPRPLAHDLMRSLLDSSGASVERVEITRIDDGTYYAEITLVTELGIRTVDARPSDAVALASRVGATIWIADAVMEEAGVPDLTVDGDGDDPDDTEISVDEFTRFLNEVDPDDFRG